MHTLKLNLSIYIFNLQLFLKSDILNLIHKFEVIENETIKFYSNYLKNK